MHKGSLAPKTVKMLIILISISWVRQVKWFEETEYNTI
jgi:hypothetical protein